MFPGYPICLKDVFDVGESKACPLDEDEAAEIVCKKVLLVWINYDQFYGSKGLSLQKNCF